MMFPVHRANANVCPVCGFRATQDYYCPNSQPMSDEFDAHRTFKGAYTDELNNPYWHAGYGFRLKWHLQDIASILDETTGTFGMGNAGYQLSRGVTAMENTHSIPVTEDMTWGLTREEVSALCAMYMFKGRKDGFPYDSENITRWGAAVLANIRPAELHADMYRFLGLSRIVYNICVDTRGDSTKRAVRTGIRRLMQHWFVDFRYKMFLTYRGAESDLEFDHKMVKDKLWIDPCVPDSGTLAIAPNVLDLPDAQRRQEYQKHMIKYGFEKVYAHMIYHMAPVSSESRRLLGDIDWVLSEGNSTDVFGLPIFLIRPCNRLERLMYCLYTMAVKAGCGWDTKRQHDFVMDKGLTLFNIGALLMYLTPDMITDMDELWYFQDLVDIYDNALTYQAAFEKPQSWFMASDRFDETVRRVTGCNPKPPIVSVIQNRPVIEEDIKTLYGGWDVDNKIFAPMLNFDIITSLLAPIINDPTVLPYRDEPRYGILLCRRCNKVSTTSNFITGCFDSINRDNSMPSEYGSATSIVLSYKCEHCGKIGCRDLTIAINKQHGVCKQSNTQLESYEFLDDRLSYVMKCNKCSGMSRNFIFKNQEIYDISESELYFGADKGNIELTGKRGEHGLPLVRISNPDNPREVRILEHPYNLGELRAGADEAGRMLCPYESKSGSGDECTGNMPSEIDTPTPRSFDQQIKVQRGEGTHITAQSTIHDDTKAGVRIIRYVCETHKEHIARIISNLGADPSLNSSLLPFRRGGIEITEIHIPDKGYVRLDSADARLSPGRVSATLRLINEPLDPIAVPRIAPGMTEIKDTMTFRNLDLPYIPVFERTRPDEQPPDKVEENRFYCPEGEITVTDYDPNASLGLDVRHLFTFDDFDNIMPEITLNPCDKCGEWDNLRLIEDTMPFERVPVGTRLSKPKRKIRPWDVSRNPSKIIPERSMPFIPYITPKESYEKILKSEIIEDWVGFVCIHIDMSGSTRSGATVKVDCPYIRFMDECRKCGNEFTWTDGRCQRTLSLFEIEKRFCVAMVNDAERRGDTVAIYAYQSEAERVIRPTKEYDHLKALALTYLGSNGATNLSKSLALELEDIKSDELPKRVLTVVLCDGAIQQESPGSKRAPGALFMTEEVADLLMNYGPVMVYIVDDTGSREGEYKNAVKTLKNELPMFGYDSDKHYRYKVIHAMVDDSGKALMSDAMDEADSALAKN